MNHNKMFDFRISDKVSEELDAIVDNYKEKNVTRSKLLDIALTILLSDEVTKEKIINDAEQSQFEVEPRSRQTFTIKNECVINTMAEISMFKKKYIIEYAVYYLNQRLVIADDFKSLLMDYIKADGVLL